MSLIPKRSLSCLSKAMVFLMVITVIVCIFLEFEGSKLLINNNNIYKDVHRGLPLQHSIANQFNSCEVDKTMRRTKKIFFAFFYWEELTMATNNLLHLTALAAHGGRQVVVPFVKDSQFRGVATTKVGYETLGRYYNVTALNNTLRLHGHGTLINWKGFQDVCKGRLDVLVYFDYTDLKNTTSYGSQSPPYVPCKFRGKNIFHGIKIGMSICVNVYALDSVERFEDEVLKRLPCVGILEWRGTSKTTTFRTRFKIESVVSNVLSYRDTSVFFNPKLLNIARDFIVQNIGPVFISVHIRTEKILKAGKNISFVKTCLSNLRTRIQTIMATTRPAPVFLATDFTEFGPSSKFGRPARKNSKSLMKILVPLKPIVFQPSEFKLADRGAVAIVEMNILASGKRLIVVGGGSFQDWITTQFLNKNNNAQSDMERFAC